MRFVIVAAFLLLANCGANPAYAHQRHHTRVAPPVPSFWSLFQGSTGGDVVSAARSEIGKGAVYGRRSLWCARFMNYVLERTGHRGTGSDMAKSFATLPRTDLHVGAIAVMSRRGGGHVGVVSGVTAAGDPVVISGNHGGRVRESVYRKSRVVAFVEAR